VTTTFFKNNECRFEVTHFLQGRRFVAGSSPHFNAPVPSNNFVSGENNKSSVHPPRRFSSILKSLRRAEVTNNHDIINDAPIRPIIFMPNFCSDLSPQR
jgi:hypothetical protein